MKNLLICLTLLLISQSALSKELVKYDTSVDFALERSELIVKTSFDIPESVLVDQKTRLFLNKNFEIRALSGANLVGHTVQPSAQIPPWNQITMSFKQTPDATQTITIEYAGTINSEAGHGNFVSNEGIHLSIDSAWHPFFADFSTPMIGTTKVLLPRGWKVFAPGVVSDSASGFQVSNTRPAMDVSLYAADKPLLLKAEQFAVVHDQTSAVTAKTVVTAGKQCLDGLNKRFGAEGKLERAHTILLDRAGPGFARANYISLSSKTLGSNQKIHQYLCHELAHNWTTVGRAMSHDYWMVESFAEYVSAQELKQVYGDEAFEAIVKQWQARAKGQPFVWRSDTDRRASHKVNYGLGPLALMQLEERLGQKTFAELVDWYMAEQVTETESLLNQIAAIDDAKTSTWFEQLLHGE